MKELLDLMNKLIKHVTNLTNIMNRNLNPPWAVELIRQHELILREHRPRVRQIMIDTYNRANKR